MKTLLLITIALSVLVIAWNAGEQMYSRHDDSPEYIVFGPMKLEVKDEKGEYVLHDGPYKAATKLTYAIERWAGRTVTAKTTRRIVQKIVSEKGIARVPIYTFPSMNPGTRVDANPPGKVIVSHVTIDLPGPDVLPPGKGYVLETSIEFPPHGERDARTYTAETNPFDVVE